MEASRLVEVLRGDCIESFHHGSVAVCDSTGALLAFAGDPGLSTHVRSAAKPFQALPLLLAGGVERFSLTDEEVALTAASHLGEPFHVAAGARLLEKGGFTAADLHCGAHWPFHPEAARRLRESGGEPSALHNNCAGKHAGMLLACRLRGWDPGGYWRAESPLQAEVLGHFGHYLGLPPASIPTGVDGCSLPTFHVPLRAMAAGYARLLEEDAAGWPLTAEERSARDRVTRAMRSKPEYVRGSGALTTNLMRLFGGRLLGKEGAEAYYAMALPPGESARVRVSLRLPEGPPRAVGIALKIADGQDRARDPVILEVLDELGVLPRDLPEEVRSLRRPAVRNVRGDVVGEIRPAFRLRTPGSLE